jgi:hypothetical protein
MMAIGGKNIGFKLKCVKPYGMFVYAFKKIAVKDKQTRL